MKFYEILTLFKFTRLVFLTKWIPQLKPTKNLHNILNLKINKYFPLTSATADPKTHNVDKTKKSFMVVEINFTSSQHKPLAVFIQKLFLFIKMLKSLKIICAH